MRASWMGITGIVGFGCAPDSGGDEADGKDIALLSLDLATATFTPSGTNYERVQGLTVGEDGTIWITGNTSSTDIATTAGAFQPDFAGGDSDGYVCRLSPMPDPVVEACTYFGGSLQDRSYDVEATDDGVYLAGITYSSDLPSTAGAAQETWGGDADIWVAKLSLDLSTVMAATYLGGSDTDWCRGQLELLAGGGIAVSGHSGSTDFPVTAGASQGSLRGGSLDGVVAVLDDDLGAIRWATYLGGSLEDSASMGLAALPDGDLIVGGSTGSDDLSTTPGAFQETYGGGTGAVSYYGDAFIARFTDTGSMVALSYYGGSDIDSLSPNSGLVVDARGQVAFVGSTSSSDLPLSAAHVQGQNGGGVDAFVAVMGPMLDSLLYATYQGGTANEEGSGVAFDDHDAIVFGGNTQSVDFPVTSDAAQATFGGHFDWFLTVVTPLRNRLGYSTYLGGSGTADYGDRARDIVRGPDGRFYVGGDTNSDDFPVTANAMEPDHVPGRSDGALAVFER